MWRAAASAPGGGVACQPRSRRLLRWPGEMSGRRRKPLVLAAAALAALALAGGVLAATDGAPPPSSRPPAGTPAALPVPDAPLPREPGELAAALAATSTALDAAIDRWRTRGDPSLGRPPRDVSLLALHQQRISRLLGSRRALARGTLARLPRTLRAVARDNVRARRDLSRITSTRRGPRPRIRI